MELVSVIIPYFKKKIYITETIGSVLRQTYEYLEIIIVYDDETKADLDFINNLRNKDSRIKIITNSLNLGVGESRNIGIKNVNENSEYFKKKFMFLNKKVEGNHYYKLEVIMTSLDDYIDDNNLSSIDFLKIDTEGYEYEVLLGLKNKIKNVKIIFFEHHYDNMIIKNYKFRDIHNLLVKNNFKRIFKIKMPLRKSFEYIYENNLK